MGGQIWRRVRGHPAVCVGSCWLAGATMFSFLFSFFLRLGASIVLRRTGLLVCWEPVSQQAQQGPFGTLTNRKGCVSVLCRRWRSGRGRDLKREICGPRRLASAWTLVRTHEGTAFLQCTVLSRAAARGRHIRESKVLTPR